jgi:hypothetical protein
MIKFVSEIWGPPFLIGFGAGLLVAGLTMAVGGWLSGPSGPDIPSVFN